MNINFELYKIFYFAAKNLNYSKAAEELFVSQSSISQSIKNLETALNIKLFYRSGRNIKLTQEGEALFNHVEQAYHLLEMGEKNIQAYQSLEEGQIKIGASDTITKFILIPFIKSFHKMYPKIKLHIINRPSPRCMDLLQKGEIDIGLINIDPKTNYSKFDLNIFDAFENIFIAPKSFEHLKRRNIPLKELKDLPLISLEENSTTRRIFNKFTEDHKIEYQPDFEFGSMELIVEMTKIEMGIGFVADKTAQSAIDEESVFKIDLKEEVPKIDVGMITRKNVPMSIAVKKFTEHILRTSK